MDEEVIAARLRENIPKPDQPTLSGTQENVSGEPLNQARTAVTVTDELSLYKLHEFFGEKYSPYETDRVKQVQYIYQAVANRIGSGDYHSILAESTSLMQMIGIAHSESKLYKLYQWLKLDNTRQGIEAEMRATAQ